MTSDAGLGPSADEVLTTPRAVRRRLDFSRPVERAVLEDCVRIASQAPSDRNRQRWDFVFVGDQPTKDAVTRWWLAGLQAEQPRGHVTRDESAAGWRPIVASLGDLASRLHDAPWLVIPCVRVDSRTELGDVRGQAGARGSVLPAFWSFMLAARERGLGTAWTTAHLSYEREVSEVLGLPYENVVQGALSPIAYTLGSDFRPARRAPAESFIHWDQW
jgi:nitroreductase